MRVDVWSDLVCPWCYVGFVRLEKAMAESDLEFEVYHHAFQLDPGAPLEGSRTVEHLAEAYGIGVEDAEAMMLDVTDVAASEGLNYKLAETRHGNTLLGHRLLAFAATKGLQRDLLFRLFHAYFEAAESIFTVEQLLPHAVAVGLDQTETEQLLRGGAFTDVVRYDRELAGELRVHGTPHFFFDQKVSVSGADTVAALTAAIRQAAVVAD